MSPTHTESEELREDSGVGPELPVVSSNGHPEAGVSGCVAHRPKPWMLEVGDHSHRYVHVTDADDRTIYYKYGAGTRAEADQDEADGLLIAAAPDLLEALMCAYGSLVDYIHAAGDIDAHDAALLKQVSAAIAKAEGRS